MLVNTAVAVKCPCPILTLSSWQYDSSEELCPGFQRISTETFLPPAPHRPQSDRNIKPYLPHDDRGMWQANFPLKVLDPPDPCVSYLQFWGLSWRRQTVVFSTASFPSFPAAGLQVQGTLQLAVLQGGFVALSTPGPVMLTSLSLSYRLHWESHHSLTGQVKANDLHCCAIDLVVRLKV